jgi:hypothetical protein
MEIRLKQEAVLSRHFLFSLPAVQMAIYPRKKQKMVGITVPLFQVAW